MGEEGALEMVAQPTTPAKMSICAFTVVGLLDAWKLMGTVPGRTERAPPGLKMGCEGTVAEANPREPGPGSTSVAVWAGSRFELVSMP